MVGMHIGRSSGTGAIWIRLQGELDLTTVDELVESLSLPSTQPFVVDVSSLRRASDAALAALAVRLRRANIPLHGLTQHQERLLRYVASAVPELTAH